MKEAYIKRYKSFSFHDIIRIMKIAIASDHAGFELKKHLISLLEELGLEITDFGPLLYDENDDYPDYVKSVGEYISKNNNSDEYRGIVIGGSGQGENICANRFENVRSVLIYGDDFDLNQNIAKLSRQHNDANVISFAARFINNETAEEILKIWLSERFSGDERHKRRISKIDNK